VAFCNSCGASLQGGARFCPKCGATQPVSGTVPVASTVPAPPPPPAAQPQRSSAVKVILIVVAAVVVLGILGIGTLTFVAWRVARHTHIKEEADGNVRVESPFGSVESSSNPQEVARNLGVDLYPGARVVRNNAANINVAGMHTIAVEFETDDPIDKVAEFYKSRFPRANVAVSDADHFTIVNTENKNLITINIQAQDGKTRINVANVSGKGVGGSGD